MIVPLMYQKLEGHLEEVWSEARAVRDHLGRLTSQLRSADASSFLGPAPGSVAAAAWGALLAAQQAPASGTGQPALASITSGSSSSGGEGPAPRSGGSGASGCNAPPSQVLASCNSKRLCTSAMIKASTHGAATCDPCDLACTRALMHVHAPSARPCTTTCPDPRPPAH